MYKFIELPKGNSKVFVNIDKIVYINPFNSRSTLHFFDESNNKSPVRFIVDVDYESLKAKINSL